MVTAVTSAPRRTLPPAKWTAAIAALTGAFAVGQCIGPVLAGVLSDVSGVVRRGLARRRRLHRAAARPQALQWSVLFRTLEGGVHGTGHDEPDQERHVPDLGNELGNRPGVERLVGEQTDGNH
jgi:hypothetical protein